MATLIEKWAGVITQKAPTLWNKRAKTPEIFYSPCQYPDDCDPTGVLNRENVTVPFSKAVRLPLLSPN